MLEEQRQLPLAEGVLAEQMVFKQVIAGVLAELTEEEAGELLAFLTVQLHLVQGA